MEKTCKELNLAELCHYLKTHDDYIILTHISPDGDTLGSAYALALGLLSIGKKAFVVCNDEIPHKYSRPSSPSVHPVPSISEMF